MIRNDFLMRISMKNNENHMLMTVEVDHVLRVTRMKMKMMKMMKMMKNTADDKEDSGRA